MFRKLIAIVLLLGVMVPVWAQEVESQFEELPACETGVLERYAEAILPRMWMLYLGDVSVESDAWWAVRTVGSELYVLDFRMPACAEALWLRDAVWATMYMMALAQQARYGDWQTGDWLEGMADQLVAAVMEFAPGFHADDERLRRLVMEEVRSVGEG